LSGYNISLASEYARKITAIIAPTWGTVVGFISVLGYGLLAGFDPPVLRAIIMAGIALLSLSSGRTYIALKALLFAGVCFAFLSPPAILYDPSFHLSFLATLGVIICTPIISNWCVRWVRSYTLAEMIAVTISAYVFVTPYIASSMGTISLIAPITNILVAPVIPIAMASSLMALIVSMFGYVSTFFGAILEMPLSWIVLVATNGGVIDFASINVGATIFFSVGIYVILAIWMIIVHYKISNAIPPLQSAFQKMNSQDESNLD